MKEIKAAEKKFILIAALALAVFVALAPLLPILTISQKAKAAGPILVSIVPSSTTVLPGESFTVDIVVDPQGVSDIAGIQTNFEFDPSLVEANSVTFQVDVDPFWSDNCDGTGPWCSPGIDNNAGLIGSWITASPTGSVFASTPFTLATIDMTAKTGVSGTSYLRLPDANHGTTTNDLVFSDPNGNALEYTLTNNSITVGASDTTPPTVTNVTSSTANGAYKAGDVIDISVIFSEAVTASGAPQLELETGSVDQAAVYSSGSGTDTLTFTYTVQDGDVSADLDYKTSNSLTLNGGTIRDLAGNDADLTLANPGEIRSLGYNKDIIIDTTAPTIDSYTLNGGSSSVTFNPDAGETVAIAITASENVEWTSIKIENVDDSGIYKIYYPAGSCDGGASCSETWDGSLSSGTLVDGEYRIKAKVQDAAGNIFNDYLSPYTITVDRNSPPVMVSVTITPDPAYTDSDLTANPTATDNDGDEITYTYQWHKNGADINGANKSTLNSNRFSKGDVITVTVTPNDGNVDGDPMTSDPLVISNSAPTQPTVTVTNPAHDSDDLVCAASGSTDADGDEITYSYAWQKNGVDQAGQMTNTVSADYTSVGDTWKCIATPSDGTDNGPAGEYSVVILADVDTVPPSQITDLSVSNISNHTLQLNWTAPGDDGNVGTAHSYEVRYSTTAISDSASSEEKQAWWSSAVPIKNPSPPKPKAAGSSQNVAVNSLASGTTYYFAMKSSDEAGNISELSNIVQATLKCRLTLKIRDESNKTIKNAKVKVYKGEEEKLPEEEFENENEEKEIEEEAGEKDDVRYSLPTSDVLLLKGVTIIKDTTISPQFVRTYTNTPSSIEAKSSLIALDDNDFSFDWAEITFVLTDTSVNRILHCTDWNFNSAFCNKWETSPLSDYTYSLNGNLLTVEVTDFDAYMAGYAVEGEEGGTPHISDTTPPTNTSITINEGEDTTTSASVVLNLSAEEAEWMAISNDPDFTGASWEVYDSSKNWTLTPGPGLKTVYAKFRDAVGNVSEPVSDTITLLSSQLPNYSDGTLIKTPNNIRVYVIINNKKKWIPTPEVFETLGYKWDNIVEISKQELNEIPNYEDNLIRAVGDYKVYLVVNGIIRHIPNPEIFLDYGFSWSDVKEVPRSTIDKYRRAHLIKESGKNDVYYLDPRGIRKRIPNPEVFASYNNKWEDVQVISKKEMDFYPESNLVRLAGDYKVYLVENGTTKRWITSAEAFNARRYDWNSIITINKAEFDYYKTGEAIRE